VGIPQAREACTTMPVHVDLDVQARLTPLLRNHRLKLLTRNFKTRFPMHIIAFCFCEILSDAHLFECCAPTCDL
jgi:hypothetical protein